MRIGIIGAGVVGTATARSYLEHVDEVRVFDIQRERRTHEYTETLQSDIIFICLPTPQKKDSLECDISHIEGFFSDLTLPQRSLNFVLRSTVPIGTTRKLHEKFNVKNLVHSPEFLTARCANVDAQIPSRNVIGERKWRDMVGQGFVITPIPWTDCGKMLRDLYTSRFPQSKLHLMTSDNSEAVKLFQNSFFAVKVAFWNEINALSDKLGLNWGDIKQAIISDGRIHPSHTNVPGPDGKYGFGGTCLIPETPISTPAGWINIEDLDIGDDVCSHEGITKVTGISQRQVDQIVTVRARGRAVSGSLDHIHMEMIKGKFIRQKLLGEFRPGDWIIQPWQHPPEKQETINLIPIPYAKKRRDSITWTKDLAWAVGLWLAEGFRGIYKTSTRSNHVVAWTLGSHEIDMADKLQSILESEELIVNRKLKISPNATFGESRTILLRVRASWFYYFLESLGVSSTCYVKRCPMNCPFPEELIGGWLDGDGSISKGTISGHSESLDMITDIDRLLSSLKISSQVSNDGKKLKISMKSDVERVCNWTTRLTFDTSIYSRNEPNRSPTLRSYDGGTVAIVQDVVFSEGGSVVAIETENSHYIANGQLTHNCLPKDLANLIECYSQHDLDATICEAAYERNLTDRERK